jgi:hypothetical protein
MLIYNNLWLIYYIIKTIFPFEKCKWAVAITPVIWLSDLLTGGAANCRFE